MTKHFEIPDSAVEAAMKAFYGGPETMRAAIEAALPIILGEPVAEFRPGCDILSLPESVFLECSNAAIPLYALTESKEKGDV